jgi:hypothetical protein
MIAKPDFLKPGNLVKVNGYVGRIVELAESETSLMVKVESAKAARRFQRPDWLEYTIAPELWEPATLQDLLDDAEKEKRAALKSLEAVEKYVSKVTTGTAASS